MIVQVLPSISPHDAISQHVIRIDDELVRNNIESKIIAQYIHPKFSNRVSLPTSLSSFDELHVLYHMSIASPLAEKIHDSKAKVDLWYHNITPAEFFEPWEPYVSLELRIARHQLAQMAVRGDRGVAASEYSEAELKKQGCRHTCVMPVLFDVDSKVMSNAYADAKSKTGIHILSVGRFAPHKRIEKMIEVVSIYKELISPNVKLDLVGSSSSKWYLESLELLVSNLKLEDSVKFHADIDDSQLANFYRDSDVYLCLSEHEGFCVPLVEAQCAGLPIVAKDFAAIPETVGKAGIVLDKEAEIVDVVAAIDVIINNEQLRSEIVSNAKANMELHNVDKEAKRAVEWLLEGSL